MRIMITGGGTGGHVYPALTIAEAADRLGIATPDEMLYVGSARGIEASLAPRRGIRFESIRVAPVVGRAWWKLPAAAITIGRGIVEAFGVTRRFKPAAVLATGGYVSVPAVLGARLAGVRTLIYLPDVHPGAAVRFLSRFATRVAVTDAAAVTDLPASRSVVTGYPVRAAFGIASRSDALRHFQLDTGLPTVLVLGGSQGARSINAALDADLETLLTTVQLIHVTGAAGEAQGLQRAAALTPQGASRYRPFGFLDADMALAFAGADLVVCRAGASVLGELPVAGKPAILIPGDFARGHQMENARRLEAAGAGAVLRDAELDQLGHTILDLLADPARRTAMTAAARAMARPNAADRIARLLVVVAQGPRDTA